MTGKEKLLDAIEVCEQNGTLWTHVKVADLKEALASAVPAGPRCPKCGCTKLHMDWNPEQGFTLHCLAKGYDNNEHFWDQLELADFAKFFAPSPATPRKTHLPSCPNYGHVLVSECRFCNKVASPATGQPPQQTRFAEFDDAEHPANKWWQEHGQFMMSGGGRIEFIWACRGWIAREQLAEGVEVTGEREPPSAVPAPESPLLKYSRPECHLKCCENPAKCKRLGVCHHHYRHAEPAAAQPESAAKVEELLKLKAKCERGEADITDLPTAIEIGLSLRPYIPSQPPADVIRLRGLLKLANELHSGHTGSCSNASPCHNCKIHAQISAELAAPVTPVSQHELFAELYQIAGVLHYAGLVPTLLLDKISAAMGGLPIPNGELLPFILPDNLLPLIPGSHRAPEGTNTNEQAVAPVSGNGPEPPDIETWAKKLYSDHYHVDMSDAEWGKLSSNTRQRWLDEAKRSIEFLYRRRRKDDIKPSAQPTPKGENNG